MTDDETFFNRITCGYFIANQSLHMVIYLWTWVETIISIRWIFGVNNSHEHSPTDIDCNCWPCVLPWRKKISLILRTMDGELISKYKPRLKLHRCKMVETTHRIHIIYIVQITCCDNDSYKTALTADCTPMRMCAHVASAQFIDRTITKICQNKGSSVPRESAYLYYEAYTNSVSYHLLYLRLLLTFSSFLKIIKRTILYIASWRDCIGSYRWSLS